MLAASAVAQSLWDEETGRASEVRSEIAPAPGDFTCTLMFRNDGYAPVQPDTEWRTGMIVCSETGYYDGWRVYLHDSEECRPVFQIGRAEGGISIESSECLPTGAWHHVAVSWKANADDPAHGVARLYADGALMAESPADRPAPILKGAPLRFGYSGFGLGALKMSLGPYRYDTRAWSPDEVREWHAANRVPDPATETKKAEMLARAKLISDSVRVPPEPDEPAFARTIAVGPEAAADGAAALSRALDEVRALRAAGETGAVCIAFPKGRFRFNRTVFISDPALSGVTVKGGGAEFTGAREIPAADFAPVEDGALRARIPAEVADRVVAVKTDVPDAGASCGVGVNARSGALLYRDGGKTPMRVCRFPSDGTLTAVCTNGAWRCDDPAAPRPPAGARVMVLGYWKHDWADATLPMETQADGSFKPLERHCYGFRANPRVQFTGIPEALKNADDWCFAGGMLCIVKPDGGFKSVAVPEFSGPFIDVENAGGVTLDGIRFSGATGDALHARHAPGFGLSGCAFRGIGGIGAVIDGCDGAFIRRCRFEETGHDCMRLLAGDRAALRAGGAAVAGCEFRRSGLLARTYTPGILFQGVGNVVEGCLFEDMPSSALRVEGNCLVVRGCVFRDCVKESDDQGAVDIWGNPTYRNCVFAGNRFENVGGGGMHACGRAAIRFDDRISGMFVISNEFINASRGTFGAVQIHAGHFNTIAGNRFTGCARGVTVTRWGEKRWLESLDSEECRAHLRITDGREALWLEHAPELRLLRDCHAANYVFDNIFTSCPVRIRGLPANGINSGNR